MAPARILSAAVAALLLGCGQARPPAPRPDDDVIERVPPPATAPGEVGTDLAALNATPPAQLPAAVDALDPASLADLHGALARDAPARPWVALRLARLHAHRRDARAAEGLLAEVVAGGGPAAAPARATLDRLVAGRTTRPGRVGVLLPLSGPFAAIGGVALAGVRLAGEAWPDVELVVADTAGDADRARQLVDEMVHEKQVVALIGPVGSLESRAAALAAERLEIPIMTLSASDRLSDAGTFVFRHRVGREAQGRAIARYAVEEMGLRSFAILYPDGDYGRDLMRAFWQTVERLGGEVRGAQGYPLNGDAFEPAIKKLIGRYHLEVRRPDPRWAHINRKARDRAFRVPPVVDFEAIFVPDAGPRLRKLLPFLPYWDIELRTAPDLSPLSFAAKYGGDTPQLVQLLGASGFNDPALAGRAARGEAQAAHNAVFVDGFYAEAPAARAFVEAWVDRERREPPALAAHAYDAAHLVARAARGRGDRAEVRRALLAIDDHRGVFGPTRMAPSGDVELDLHVLTIRPGEGVVPHVEREALDEDEVAPEDASAR